MKFLPLYSKRGQGISVNMIVLIVIALIVLLVVALMINKYSSKGNQGFDSTCTTIGNTCQATACATGMQAAGTCPSSLPFCCQKTTTP